jgi:SAM-dependent methyltransferase
MRRRLVIDDIDAVRDAGAKAHYEDPDYYAFAYRGRRRDIAFYTRMAERFGGPVLEYGAGSGRVALPIARSGFEIVCVDCSKPMLGALTERLEREPEEVRERVKVVLGDMRTLTLRRKFPLVIAPFNTVLHLYEVADVEAFFARVRRHLAPGGRFVFDFSVPSPHDLGRDPNQRFKTPRFRHPSAKKSVRYAERFEYHPLRQLLVIWMEFEPVDGSEGWVVPLSHRQFFPLEMQALLGQAGFSEIELFSDFSERPASDDTDSLVLIARV